ncbi:MAG: chemotaxis protein CheW [Clostridia bacterium]|jgi:purine-binding chemotaxis protein CheW|nr:chemotaxis protein CheW [Clostridia bacterium]MDD3094035.1 chemotaxis protein CheW [Clostridia bacterium]MDD3970859.1 chemotaxis protein CheW [Clostridia bacterium]MDD4543699.1 chemotaxis protein CheW [Clostridia bacterium]
MDNDKNMIQIEEDTQKDRYLTFSIGTESFGVDIKYVTEIIGIQPITIVPEVPDYVKGIINLRGKIIPVIDIRLKFKKESIEYDDRTCIIVVEVDEVTAGFIVDNVTEVITIAGDDIVPPPEYKECFQNNYIKNIGKTPNGIKLLLDCQMILSGEII